MIMFRRLLSLMGMEPERVQVTWVSAAEGKKFAELATAMVEKARKLGPNTRFARTYAEPFTSDHADPPPAAKEARA